MMRESHTGKLVKCWQRHVDIDLEAPYIGRILDEYVLHWELDVRGTRVKVLKGSCSDPFSYTRRQQSDNNRI